MSHHPTEHLLTEYSAGSLSAGPALCVTTHIEQCHECERRVGEFNLLGAAILESGESIACSDDLFDRVMMDVDTDTQIKTLSSQRKKKSALSALLPDGIESANWKSLGLGVRSCDLGLTEDGFVLKLLRVAKGRRVFQHTHTDAEFTVLLQGGYSDELGNFVAGDFVECDASHVHQPVAHRDQDCVLLTAVSGDLKFTGPISRLFNPIFKF
ncbi:MAG: ChrR family anti-sigma-E factor [Pseudomonadales bacterium]